MEVVEGEVEVEKERVDEEVEVVEDKVLVKEG